LRFVLDEPAPVFVAMRAGVASRGAAIRLDGKPSVRCAHPRALHFERGRRPRRCRPAHSTRSAFPLIPQTEALAEVDWVRRGLPKKTDARTYAPPTQMEIVASVPLAGVPQRSVALRASSSAC
jgi:hypothetical protein